MIFDKKQQGFTLIELLIVITFIAVLAAISIPKYSQSKNAADVSTCKTNLHELESAIEKYNYDNSTTLSAGSDLSSVLVPNYLKTMPVEPEGGTYTYEVVSGSLAVICSKGHTL